MPMTPQYSTVLMTDVWSTATEFVTDYTDCEIPQKITNTNATTLFYLLFAKYGNSPIANNDINQFKYKVFSIIFQYGGTWEKRVDIQDKIRALSDDELRAGSLAIYNHALNPGTTPSVTEITGGELTFINEQNTTKFKKSKMEAYTMLWDLLSTDVTGDFVNQFKRCFKQFVMPEEPLLYSTEE